MAFGSLKKKNYYSSGKTIAEDSYDGDGMIELDPCQVDSIYKFFLTLKYQERTGEFQRLFRPVSRSKPRLGLSDMNDLCEEKADSYDSRFINKIFNYRKRPQEYDGQLLWSKSDLKRIIYTLEELERDDELDALYTALRLIYNYKIEGNAPEGEEGF